MSIRNVLFVMCDQLRWDHLSCYGHPYLQTPNIDALARRGVVFDNAFVQAGVCVPSRMSYYTGRYVTSHGSTYNRVPLSVDERTLGEYLRAAGRELVLAGKTHVVIDAEGLSRLDVDGHSELGRLIARGSFIEIDRYDGHHEPHEESGYPAFLRAHGYAGERPWNDYVISVVDEAGEVRSGWNMRYVRHAARVREAHSETAYMTDQAIRFIESKGDTPWALHLSYVKPHWPYVAPAPYHAMYSPADCLPVARNEAERRDAHPVLAAYRRLEESLSMATDEAVATVRPVYQGLIRQLDDHFGRLWSTLERLGRDRDTLIVFTADHGDFLGDHWQGEKELMYELSVRLPFIVVDPTPGIPRGVVSEALVEAIDLLPTFVEAVGAEVATHIVEGRSILAHVRGAPAPARDAVFAEMDYAIYPIARKLGFGVRDARMVMACSGRWKYVHLHRGYPPLLFDLQEDPHELDDRGADPALAAVRDEHVGLIADWMLARRNRIAISDAAIAGRPSPADAGGVIIGKW